MLAFTALESLAKKWAPICYQYINQTEFFDDYLTKMDLLVPVNMDSYRSGNNSEKSWDSKNIREKLKKTSIENLVPVVYYSFAETENHMYLLYSFYHADDTTHPNDMEGCLIILEKPEKLLGMLTIAHHKIPKYVYQNTLSQKNGDAMKKLLVEYEEDEIHPLVEQESGKHGMYGLGKDMSKEIKIWRTLKIVFGQYQDKIVFFPGKNAKKYDISQLRQYVGTPHYPTFYYDLVYIHDKSNGLIHRRDTAPNSTFQENGKFHHDAANPPWLWKHENLSIWENPAEVADTIFSTKGKSFDSKYVSGMNNDLS